MTRAPAPTIPASVRVLRTSDLCCFTRLAELSDLPTFQNRMGLGRLLRTAVVLGAFAGTELVGCACLDHDVVKQYISVGGRLTSFPVPNVYLCGAFVRPDRRREGIGTRLYARRLELARSLTSGAVIVELLGTGDPGSVHPDSESALRIYERAGFHPLGHSIDPDAGVVLMWPPSQPDQRSYQ
jgi:GNAT superfamily N-acetyltransferase